MSPEEIKLLEAFLEQLKEANMSAAVGGYSTPHAFGKKKSQIIKVTQGKPVKESISYRDYKKDETRSPKFKLNKSIIEINRRLEEIQKILDNNIKLQEEYGLEDVMWKLSPQRINKIMKRLLYISNKIKELG